jgi:hypothetical protein
LITKAELRTRLFHMVSIFLVSALVTMCGFIVVPELTIHEMDANTMIVIKFATITAFLVHIFGMLCISALLVGDTMERIVHTKAEESE